MAWCQTGSNPSQEPMMSYRNWYQDWGHCGVTNDLGSSPQPEFHTFINSSVSDKKQASSKMSFYQQSTISLYSWFLLVLSCNIFLMTFHGPIFLNIKLGPTTTSSPRRPGCGLHNPDSSHDQIRFFWLAEVRNFTNIMIEWFTYTYVKLDNNCWNNVHVNGKKLVKVCIWVAVKELMPSVEKLNISEVQCKN